ncbi:hypothetical protein ENHY17A_50401 [Moraxellaceae bacterium 17A]|nr:hypothetical protein ENHY17A_50401 [Moraxellaceae bacterium 17A]
MNRTIISKIAIKYDDIEVLKDSFVLEIAPLATASAITDAQAIAAFFSTSRILHSNIRDEHFSSIQNSQPFEIPKVDNNHESVFGTVDGLNYGYMKSFGLIEEYINSSLVIRMMNIVDGIEQYSGMEITGDPASYTPKKISVEIYQLSQVQIQNELASLQAKAPFTVNTTVESLYDLLYPLVPDKIPALDEKNYSIAERDENKITLHANAMFYVKMLA